LFQAQWFAKRRIAERAIVVIRPRRKRPPKSDLFGVTPGTDNTNCSKGIGTSNRERSARFRIYRTSIPAIRIGAGECADISGSVAATALADGASPEPERRQFFKMFAATPRAVTLIRKASISRRGHRQGKAIITATSRRGGSANQAPFAVCVDRATQGRRAGGGRWARQSTRRGIWSSNHGRRQREPGSGRRAYRDA